MSETARAWIDPRLGTTCHPADGRIEGAPTMGGAFPRCGVWRMEPAAVLPVRTPPEGRCDGCGRVLPRNLLHALIGPEGEEIACWSCLDGWLDRSGARTPQPASDRTVWP